MSPVLQNMNRAKRGPTTAPLISAALHGSAILFLVLVAAKTPRVVAVHQPGTADGKHVLLTFSTGGAPSVSESTLTKPAPAVAKRATEKLAAPMPSASESKPMAEQGTGSTGLSGLGDGNMTFAALQVHPRPQPDLSTLPRNSDGNIILNAVIDAQGSISQLTVLQSLGNSIDQQVMATVRGWSFTPATRNGEPVVSEQEIVLHYDRA